MSTFNWVVGGLVYAATLSATKTTSPAFAVRVGGVTMYAPLVAGAPATKQFGVRYNGATYHIAGTAQSIAPGIYTEAALNTLIRGFIALGANRMLLSPVRLNGSTSSTMATIETQWRSVNGFQGGWASSGPVASNNDVNLVIAGTTSQFNTTDTGLSGGGVTAGVWTNVSFSTFDLALYSAIRATSLVGTYYFQVLDAINFA